MKLLIGKYKNQILATAVVTIASLSHGIILGWASPSILLLKAEQTPLSSGPITVNESSWLGSLYSVGSMFFGNLLTGVLSNTFGRKITLCILAIPQLVFWLLVMFADQIEYLYLARICAGFSGGGIYVVAPVFLTEISNKEIRGCLSSIFVFAVNVGILVGFVVCGNLTYNIVPFCFVVWPILFFILMLLFPDTPQDLFMKGNEEKAKDSLRFYRNLKHDGAEINELFGELQKHLNESRKEGKIKISDFTEKQVQKAIFQAFIVLMVYIASGGFIIVNYVGVIFKETGADLDPNTSSIIFAVTQILGSYLSTMLGDRLTRKMILVLSSGGASIGLLATGVFAYLVNYYDVLRSYSFIPITSLCFAIFMLTMGIIPFSHVVCAEILPQKTKQITVSLLNFTANGLAFMFLKFFPIFMDLFGVFSVMLLCGIICLFATIFYWRFLTETSTKYI